MDLNNLSIALEEWFKQNQSNKDKWSKNIVGKTLKRNLISSRNWKKGSISKDQGRQNRRTMINKMKDNQASDQGYGVLY